jgi:hypothetical protein
MRAQRCLCAAERRAERTRAVAVLAAARRAQAGAARRGLGRAFFRVLSAGRRGGKARE